MLVAIAIHKFIADASLGLCELLHEEVVHLLRAYLLGQIAGFYVLSGLERHIAEHIEEMIVEHGTEEAGMSQTLLGRRIGGIDGIDHLVGIADTTIGDAPGILNLADRRSPVVLMQVDVGIAPAHTDASGHHILVCTLFEQMEHAEPVFNQITVLCRSGTEQQREVGLVREVDVRLVELAIQRLVEVGTG